MTKNKVQYNLKNVHYAKLTVTNGATTYETPIPIPGAVSLSISPVGDTTPFYADGYQYFTSTSNGGYEGEIETALLPESFLVDILGEELSVTSKVLTETNAAKAQAFALLFEFDGDVKPIRRVMYSCIATRPTIESSTSTEAIEVKPQALSFKSSARADGKIKASTTDNTPDATLTTWYSKVWDGDTEAVT